ncbi:hypothetical protein [Deinococcus sp.]|uniref:hypothetical protein n=1 Tax=Deinococcus sp. TaxID=47478 RepID=UPI003B5B99E5
MTRDLLDWADVAVCMQKRHRDWIRAQFKGVLPDNRILMLGIPDDYEFMDADLVALLERLVPGRLVSVTVKDAPSVAPRADFLHPLCLE